MRQRGRPSIESLSVIPPVLDRDGRPAPPAILTAEEASEWRLLVERMPADFFPAETWGVLIELVQNIVLSRTIARELSIVRNRPLNREKNYVRFKELVSQKLKVSELIGQQSTKLRLTNQSRLRSERAYKDEQTTRVKKPWEILGDDTAGQAEPEPQPPVDWSKPGSPL